MNTLFIDTSDNKEIIVGLRIDGKEYMSKQKIGLKKAQIVLPMIEKLFKQNSINLKDINRIRVNTGPGSFTGLRVGISIANSLGFFLRIPINGKKIGQLAQPQYK